MKPAPFVYRRVDDVDEALHWLTELGSGAKLLAGGQSLLPMMNFRLVRPAALIDISRVDLLRGVRPEGSEVRIGALTRHRDLALTRLAAGYDVIGRTAPLIGHEPIRTLGTFGGSIAHADPAAEWCALLVLLDGEVVARSARGERVIAAEDFFHGFFETELRDDEMLVEVRFKRAVRHAAVEEHARRHGDFAVVLVGVAFDWKDGRCRDPRIVAGGVDEVPLRLPEAEQVIEGSDLGSEALDECAAVARRLVDPSADVHATACHRRTLTGVLTTRALRAALQRGAQETNGRLAPVGS